MNYYIDYVNYNFLNYVKLFIWEWRASKVKSFDLQTAYTNLRILPSFHKYFLKYFAFFLAVQFKLYMCCLTFFFINTYCQLKRENKKKLKRQIFYVVKGCINRYVVYGILVHEVYDKRKSNWMLFLIRRCVFLIHSYNLLSKRKKKFLKQKWTNILQNHTNSTLSFPNILKIMRFLI